MFYIKQGQRYLKTLAHRPSGLGRSPRWTEKKQNAYHFATAEQANGMLVMIGKSGHSIVEE